ncbi:hypothetical protein [Planococcus dechangensis]|uniref:DUF4025 domain-containing protein n=1 Tax=Planococcus dechangensis TaxID=1176255 RepID=A0ABV9MBT4_9BACL
MTKDENQHAGPENLQHTEVAKNKFNSGDNDSDYDGGHPQDAFSTSEDEAKSGNSKKKKDMKEKSFNEGGNDSDYDGGHPKDAE